MFQEMGILATGSAALVQTVNRHLFNDCLVGKANEPVDEPEVSMTAMEENAIRYSAGCVSLKLLKRFEKQGDDKAAEFVECLSNMAVGGNDTRYSESLYNNYISYCQPHKLF